MRILPVLPRRTVLTFTSSSPVTPLLDGPYVLRVTGVRQQPFPLPPPPTLTMPLPSVPTRLPIGPVPESYLVRTLAPAIHLYARDDGGRGRIRGQDHRAGRAVRAAGGELTCHR